jgi:hypothetical protein
MVTALRVLLAIAAVATSANSHAVLVVNYEFDDQAGPLSTAVNSGAGTIAAWGADADATLNGMGQLAVTGPLGFQARALTSDSAISSGTAFLRVDIASWGSIADPFFVFGLRAQGPGAVNQGWRLQFSSGDASDNDPAGRIFEVTANSMNSGFNSFAGGIPAVSGSSSSTANGLSVIMGINLDDDTTSVWWDLGRTGNYVIAGGRDNVAVNSSGLFTDFNLIDAIQLQSNGGPFSIDRLVLGTEFTEIASIGAIPEPSLVAAFGAVSVGMAASLRRRSIRSE